MERETSGPICSAAGDIATYWERLSKLVKQIAHDPTMLAGFRDDPLGLLERAGLEADTPLLGDVTTLTLRELIVGLRAQDRARVDERARLMNRDALGTPTAPGHVSLWETRAYHVSKFIRG
jgi:hypothetical protein